MATEMARGTKRWCQDEACGLPFYDLNKTNLSCPNCGAVYKIVTAVAALRVVTEMPRKWGTPRASAAVEKDADPASEIASDDDETEVADTIPLDDLLEADDGEEADVPATTKHGEGTPD